MANNKEPKAGDLQIWWVPQVPMTSFRVDVESIEQAAFLLNTLALYDLFQLKHKVKPDYSNAGGLQVFEDGEWVDWYDDETGESDPEEYLAAKKVLAKC